MASGRIIHKAIHSNPDLGELEIQIRYFYKALIVHSDDDGRMRANPKHLKALIFPFDESLRVDTLSEWLEKLHASGLICLYVVGEKLYLYHPNWKNWQSIRSDRYKASDCPDPSLGIPSGNQRGHNLTQPNLTEPNKKPAEKPAEFSEEFIEKAEKAKGLGVNIYQLLGFYKKNSKVCEPIPEPVLNKVLDSVIKYAPKGDKFPYFLKALAQESMAHFASLNNPHGEDDAARNASKRGPAQIGDILKMAQGNKN